MACSRGMVPMVASCLLAAALLLPGTARTQVESPSNPSTEVSLLDELGALRFRHIGPYRGGRSTAVSGIPDQPFTFYMGSTGGGLFKTTDAGTSWSNVSDGDFAAGSIGAISVASSNPDVVYVGTGSACPRGNISPGIGMYKSIDAGETWTHIGLDNAGQIGKLAIHPQDPNIVYAAVLGQIFGPNQDRGVFRSTDGGEKWEKVLFLDEQTGAVDLQMDPADPDTLYAAFWRAERKPWTIISGGPVGGIYKSTDGGDHWEKLTAGLPTGMTGRIGIAVSPANPNRIWAIIEGERTASGFENDETGMYRSEDAGRTWEHLSADPLLHQRPWYYHHLAADPIDENVVYHVGDSLWKSTDGGYTFETMAVPHVDQHDLWINPNDPKIMIEASDGGGIVTLNGGETWSSQLNQPTAETYRIAVDDAFPYRVYAGQQDYSTISLPSRVFGAGGITLQHWRTVGGGEMGPVDVNPQNADIVYAGGFLSRTDLASGQVRRIAVHPQYWSGVPPSKLKYRVPFDSPVRVSRHDPDVVYTTSQFVHRTRNGGQSWEVISPDLTRNDPDKIVVSGGPLTRDITSVETYCTIFAFDESHHNADVLWVGSDDGLVHLSRNGGRSWSDVTPDRMPEWGRVNTIELSRHVQGRAIISVTRYKLNDFQPYVFATDDFGKSWKLLTDGTGIPDRHFIRVAREDPAVPGLLYAGGEFGLYISFDDGDHWHPFQQNLPVTPISDIAVHQGDLVVSTQGRGFWILDDLTPLHQLDAVDERAPFLFRPRDVHRVEGGWRQPGAYVSEDNYRGGLIENFRVGENAPPGALIHYRLPNESGGDVNVTLLDANDEVVRRYTGDQVESSPGVHRLVWDLGYTGADIIEGSRLDGHVGGPRALPGKYTVQLEVGQRRHAQQFNVRPDPRSSATQADLRAQFELALAIRDRVSETHDLVRRIHDLQVEVDALVSSADDDVGRIGGRIRAALDGLEDRLRQKRAKVWQDTANFEPLLDDQFAWLASYILSAEARPPDVAYERFDELAGELDEYVARLESLERDEMNSLRAITQ